MNFVGLEAHTPKPITCAADKGCGEEENIFGNLDIPSELRNRLAHDMRRQLSIALDFITEGGKLQPLAIQLILSKVS